MGWTVLGWAFGVSRVAFIDRARRLHQLTANERLIWSSDQLP